MLLLRWFKDDGKISSIFVGKGFFPFITSSEIVFKKNNQKIIVTLKYKFVGCVFPL